MEAIDIDLLISPTVVDTMLVVRVCVAGLLGAGIGNPWSSCGPPEDVLLLGITLPLIVWCS